jgi:hypothetical protein
MFLPNPPTVDASGPPSAERAEAAVENVAKYAHTRIWSTLKESKLTPIEEIGEVTVGPPSPTVICGCRNAIPFGQQSRVEDVPQVTGVAFTTEAE